MEQFLATVIREAGDLLPRPAAFSGGLEQVGLACGRCWDQRGKVLVAANGRYRIDHPVTRHRPEPGGTHAAVSYVVRVD